ncbi:MAG: hypothetical protein ACC707_05195 [Thiohalomonadales bacterium]
MAVITIRKSNIILGIAVGLLCTAHRPENNNIDIFFAAELFFNAWVIVLVFLLAIMVISLLPIGRHTSDKWHKPSRSISPLNFWREPINFIHYYSVSMIIAAIMAALIASVSNGHYECALNVLSIGFGGQCALFTAPLLFKGNFAKK